LENRRRDVWVNQEESKNHQFPILETEAQPIPGPLCSPPLLPVCQSKRRKKKELEESQAAWNHNDCHNEFGKIIKRRRATDGIPWNELKIEKIEP
jgi:hypothetical protein